MAGVDFYEDVEFAGEGVAIKFDLAEETVVMVQAVDAGNEGAGGFVGFDVGFEGVVLASGDVR